MIKINCPLCDKDNCETFKYTDLKNDILHISICKNDGFIYLNPRWNEEEYEDFYNSKYDDCYRQLNFVKQLMKNDCHPHAVQIDKRLPLNFCPKSILDIGSGPGHISRYFKNKFKCKIDVVEYSELSLKFLYEHLNIIPICNKAEDISKIKFKYDLIIMRQVLEHIENPLKLLKDIKGLMDEDSLLYISIPNLKLINSFRKIFQIPHVNYFSITTFLNFINKVDLHIEDIGEGMDLFGIFKKVSNEYNISKLLITNFLK